MALLLHASLILVPAIFGLLAPCCMAVNSLYSPGTLSAGESLVNGNYVFIMQNDCNLVLYDSGVAKWASNTNGRGSGCRLVLQSDGNLVVYLSNTAIWASNTNIGQNRYNLILQDDRNVVVYIVNGRAIWATGTNRRKAGVAIEGEHGINALNQTSPVVVNQTSVVVVNANEKVRG